MTTFYDDLGIDPSADEAEIKAAHRKRAKDTHPDRGGDPDEFQRVTQAALVLLDADKRAKYDQTGEYEDEPDNSLTMDTEMMAKAFEIAMQNARGNFKTHNLVRSMKAWAAEEHARIKGEIAKGEDATKRYDAMLERIKFTGNGPNLLERILSGKRTELRSQITGLTKSLLGFERLQERLIDYDWRVDESPASGWPPRPMAIGQFTIKEMQDGFRGD